MTAFIPKKISLEESPGEKLRVARQYRQLKIEEIAKKINIRGEYLIALEEERFDRLPTGLYGKNFLKEYAAFLKLDYQDLIKNLAKNTGLAESDDPFSQKIVKRNKFIIFPKIVRGALMIAAVLVCFLYLIFYFTKIFWPPDLTVSQPEKNLLISGNSLLVSGATEPEAEVKINGETVLNNNNGQFYQTVNLKKGLNNIVISAQKKYSRERIILRQILVE